MQFEFVDNSSIDRATRRRIRRRAAEGRNAGRKLSRPSRKAAFANNMATVRPFPVHARLPRSAGPHDCQPPADSNGSSSVGGISCVNTPVSPSPVVDLGSPHSAISPLPAHLRRHAPGYEGSALIQSDFHGAVAVYLSYRTRTFPPPYHCRAPQDLSSSQTRHLCRALRLINSRLSREHAASNENLIAVMILGLYERQQGAYHRGLVHLTGLERMIQLRGGLAALTRSKSGLARKVFRSDIECSLHLGTPTRFALDQVEPLLSVNALTPSRISVFLDDTAGGSYYPASSSSNSLFLLNLLLRDATQIARLLTAAVAAAAAAAAAITASATASHDPPGTAAAAATTTTTTTTMTTATTATATTCRLSSASVHDTFILLGYRVQAVASSLHLLQAPLLPRAGAEEAEEEHQRKRFINPATSTNPTNDEGAHVNNNNIDNSSSSSRTATDPIQRALCAGLAAFVGSFFWATGGGENQFPVPWLAALAREVSWEAAATTRTAPAEIAL